LFVLPFLPILVAPLLPVLRSFPFSLVFKVTFQHKGFEETRRLGLRNETEQMVRLVSPSGETGMLVVDSVVPEGPAHKHLEPGDVLVRMNDEVSNAV
jgi:S1-C subfamily serine protease